MKLWAALLTCIALVAGIGARAQPVLGLVQYEAAPDGPSAKLLLDRLAEEGLVEGRNLRIERRYANGDKSRFAPLLQDLAGRRVNATVVLGHDMAKVAKQVVPAMPVLAFGSEDPVLSGLVASLSRPGGQVTGVTFNTGEIAEKRLEILRDTMPGVRHVVVLWEPEHVDRYYDNMVPVAARMGIRLTLIKLQSPAELDAVPAAVRQAGAQFVFVVPSRITQSNSRKLAQMLLDAGLPSMSAYHTYVEAGGLISYGADIPELFKRLAIQTRRVLAGEKPGDLPVELPNRLVLVVNRVTARKLGIEIPQSILFRADRVID